MLAVAPPDELNSTSYTYDVRSPSAEALAQRPALRTTPCSLPARVATASPTAKSCIMTYSACAAAAAVTSGLATANAANTQVDRRRVAFRARSQATPTLACRHQRRRCCHWRRRKPLGEEEDIAAAAVVAAVLQRLRFEPTATTVAAAAAALFGTLWRPTFHRHGPMRCR